MDKYGVSWTAACEPESIHTGVYPGEKNLNKALYKNKIKSGPYSLNTKSDPALTS